MLRSLLNFLDGKKSYIGILAGAVVYFCDGMGWIADTTVVTTYAIITAWTGVAFRKAISKASK